MIENPNDRNPAERWDRYLPREAAALRLGIDFDQMVCWNMVVMIPHRGGLRVPEWSADPRVARYMPMLSEYFEGEAMELCLLTMRPLGDDRNGVEALRDGEWRAVRDVLADHRRRFDQILSRAGTSEWIARYCA